MKKTFLLLVTTLILAISAQAQSFVGNWNLTFILIERDMAFLITSPITLNISKDGKIGGNGGCNSFGGNYKYKKPSKIKFTDILSTQMFCDGSSETEKRFFQSLQDANKISVRNGELIIENQKIGNSLTFSKVKKKTD